MTSVAANRTNILLEAGTNELEVIVFQLGTQPFGVNVAKVREILEIGEVTKIAHCHEAVDGVVTIRKEVITLVDLNRFLYGDNGQSPGELMLLLEFNGEQVAFRVSSVSRIHRLSWNDVQPMPSCDGMEAPVTAIVNIDDTLVPILDFESMGSKLGMASSKSTAQASVATKVRAEKIIFADDCRLVRKKMQDHLLAAGYTDVSGFTNGGEAWDFLSMQAKQAGNAREVASVVITDIEMPCVDGLTLTGNIRRDPLLNNIPVVVFSSIASISNRNKAEQVGASAQVSKPDYVALIDKLDELLSQQA